MTKKSGLTAQSITGGENFILSKFAVAAVIYAVFAFYLYYPYLGKNLHNILQLRNLFVINTCLASLGCFVLSRRWVASFCGSFFAGAIYGFGALMFDLAGYHPTAGLLAAAIPWLFCPAAFGPKANWRILSWLLSALPFLAIVLFFKISARFGLFAMPIQPRPHLADLVHFFVILFMTIQCLNPPPMVGAFYHISIAPLIMGTSMLFAARRLGIMIIFCTGTILAFCHSVFNVSPVIWFAIPTLCCSVLIGAGIQGLVLAGSADRKWILAITFIMAACSLVALLIGIRAGLSIESAKMYSAKMYLVGAIIAAIFYLMACANLHTRWMRLALLCSALAVDIFFGSRFLIDWIL